MGRCTSSPGRLSWHTAADLFMQKAMEGGGTSRHLATAVQSDRFDGHLGALTLKVPLSMESLFWMPRLWMRTEGWWQMPGYGYPETTKSFLCSLTDFKIAELFLSIVKFAQLTGFFPSQVKQEVNIQLQFFSPLEKKKYWSLIERVREKENDRQTTRKAFSQVPCLEKSYWNLLTRDDSVLILCSAVHCYCHLVWNFWISWFSPEMGLAWVFIGWRSWMGELAGSWQARQPPGEESAWALLSGDAGGQSSW